MTVPTLATPFSLTYATGATNTLTLTPPSVGEVKFYVVGIGGMTDPTPVSSPAFQRPRDTYDQRWPTITSWESPWFALAVRGSVDLPTLEWVWGDDFDYYTVAAATISDCSFQLRVANVYDAVDDQLSPAAQPGALYSIRGGIGLGDALTSPPLPQLATVVETATLPALAADPTPSGGTPFSAIYATVTDFGPPTIGNDVETFAVSTWATNSAFFPDVWGSTLSIYPPGDDPDSTYGWHTGRIGWG